jgi:hypothetical protein
MKRREFIAGLGSAAAWPLAVRAQQRTKPITIGMLDGLRVSPFLPPWRREDTEVDGFWRGLAEVGFSESDITIDYRTPSTELAEKRLQLLHEAVPSAETIALLVGVNGRISIIRKSPGMHNLRPVLSGCACWFST